MLSGDELVMSKSSRRGRDRALIDAILLGDAETARRLLDKGADAIARDEQNNNEPVLLLAAQFAGAPMVRLLLERGAKADACDDSGVTA